MSETDKTGEKLVASMRKTKAGTNDKPAAAPKTTTPARKKTAAKSATGAAARKAKQPQQPRDPYQAGRRIWPD